MKPSRASSTLAAILLLLQLLGSLACAVTLGGTWYLEGVRSTGSQHALTPATQIWGTVQISGGQITFATNAGTFARASALSDGNLDAFQNEVVPHPITSVPITVSSTRARVQVVDDNTLVLVFGKTLYTYDEDPVEKNFKQFTSFEWMGGVLTRSPVPARTTPLTRAAPWPGEYSRTRIGATDNNFQAGIQPNSWDSYDLQFLHTSGGSIVVAGPEGPEMSLSSTGNFATLSNVGANSSRNLWQTLPLNDGNGNVIGRNENYVVLERDEALAIYLGGGRVACLQVYARLGEGVNIYDSGATNTYQYILESELECALLTQQAIAYLTQITPVGATGAEVVRAGQKFPLYLGDPLYQGDFIHTPASTLHRVEFVDQSSMNISGGSIVEIEKFDGATLSIINIITGKLRDYFKVPGSPGKLQLKTSNTVIGVRGTTFDFGYSETGGVGTSTLDVTTGVVDATDISTGTTQAVGAGQSFTASTSVQNPTLTIQVPGQGLGAVSVNGTVITTFPHTITVPRGTELTLLALPAVDKEFHRWWGGSQELLSEECLHTVKANSVLNCEFKLPAGDADQVFADDATAQGLSGPAADLGAIPFADGTPNLLKWAFNMNLGAADHRQLVFDGATQPGLPAHRTTGTGRVELQFLRRTDGALIYRPMVSDNLVDWRPMGSTEVTQPHSPGWERVTLSTPLPAPASKPTPAFMRVDVDLP